MGPKPESPKPRPTRSAKLIVVLSMLCVVAIGGGIFFYVQYARARSASTENQRQIAQVASMVELPSEAPTTMTVADKSRLQNKALAAKVQNGDVLMIFTKSKRLIIYRPATEKVVDMLTFAQGDSKLQPKPTQ